MTTLEVNIVIYRQKPTDKKITQTPNVTFDKILRDQLALARRTTSAPAFHTTLHQIPLSNPVNPTRNPT